jgi:LEA14-like dessication related protein
MRACTIVCIVLLGLGACANLPSRDPLVVDVAGIEPLTGEGMELRFRVAIRIQNPNDAPVEYSGAALDLSLNGRRAASGVSDARGTVPRYGETVLYVPVTISAFNMVSQLVGFMSAQNTDEVSYRIRGKLEGGLFGTRRFSDEGSIALDLPNAAR